jgi:hypothetical protein
MGKPGWKVDKAWSDRFISEIKSILGQVLISEAPVEEDQKRNTDLLVLRLDSMRIACRVRKHPDKRYKIYRRQFTIRASRPSGTQTELAKIMAGWGDYIFYGIADPTEAYLCHWRIGNLEVFRGFARFTGCAPGELIENHDRSSSFRIIDWDSMPPEFVIAKGGAREQRIFTT